MKSAVVIGIGIGGLADGIVLHHILQWHNMISARVPPITMAAMRQNMLCDGLFDLVMLLITIGGLALLWRELREDHARASGRLFLGEVLIGWGAFNLVEGLIDHQILELHHVHDLPVFVPSYDWWFLAFAGVGLTVIGGLLATGGHARARPARHAVF